MEQNIFYKQEKLFNPNKDLQPKIFVYGLGSIGSHVIMGLAKTGFKNITGYDYDVLEDENLPAQFYPDYATAHTKSKKTVELSTMVKFMTGTEINLIDQKITEEFTPNLEIDSIHIVAFDNIEGREILFEKLNKFPIHFIDGRIGGFQTERYYFYGTNEEQIKEYYETLKGEFSEEQCGEKCLWAVNSLIASKIISYVLNIVKNKEKQIPLKVKENLLAELRIIKEN